VKLGNWLGKHVNRIEAGLRIERRRERQGAVLWQCAVSSPWGSWVRGVTPARLTWMSPRACGGWG
jgi:hypothetical protein